MLRHPDPRLSDGVITLRAKARSDVDALTAACQDPEIPRWTRVPVPYRRADAIGWIAASELELAAGLGIDWLAVDAEDRLLASVALMGIARERATAEIGYWVAREARGRGVATRAVRLVSEWAASELGLTTLELVIHEDNAPSHAVARAAGYTETEERRVAPREGLPEGRYLVHHWPTRSGHRAR
ncbi:MAG: GNAT family N-acetyltransferase [Solirubrobacteraceae bacterium]